MSGMTMESFELLRMAVREAARDAWTDLRSAHPGDTFYYYGLWTTQHAHSPVPTASSFEGLKRSLAEHRENGLELNPADLRWSENDSPYDLYGDEHFLGVERLFEEFGNPFDRERDVRNALLETVIGALADLDDDRFFGSGAERESVVINVTFPGRNTPASVLGVARRLNPPAALERYERDWLAR